MNCENGQCGSVECEACTARCDMLHDLLRRVSRNIRKREARDDGAVRHEQRQIGLLLAAESALRHAWAAETVNCKQHGDQYHVDQEERS